MRPEHAKGAGERTIDLFTNRVSQQRHVQRFVRATQVPDCGRQVDRVHEPDICAVSLHEPRKTLDRADAPRRPVNRQDRPERVAVGGPPPPDDEDSGVRERFHALRRGAHEDAAVRSAAGAKRDEIDPPLLRHPEDLGRGMAPFAAVLCAGVPTLQEAARGREHTLRFPVLRPFASLGTPLHTASANHPAEVRGHVKDGHVITPAEPHAPAQ